MSVEINTKNYQKPNEDKPIVDNNYNHPQKQEGITWTHIVSFIIVMIIWAIMEGY